MGRNGRDLLRIWLAALAMLLLLGAARAQDDPVIETVSVLTDPAGSLTLEDVKSSSDWRDANGSRYSTGYGTEVLWFRLRVSGAATAIAILSIRPSFLDDVTFFLPDATVIRPGQAAGDRRTSYRQGDRLPLSDRIYAVRGFAVPVGLHANVAEDIYIRLQTTSTRLLVADLVWADAFVAGISVEALLGGASYMLILAMLVFAGMQWWRTREPVYAAHVGLAVAIGLFFLARSGDLSLILADAPLVADRMVGISVCLALGGLVLFVAQTLPTRAGLALGTWPANIMMAVVGLSTLVSILGYYDRIAGAFAILIMVSIVYLLTLSLLAREGDLVLRTGRVLALALFVPTGLLNLGLANIYWQAEIALNLGTLGLLIVLVAIAWREASLRRETYNFALADAHAARVEARLKEQSMAQHRQWTAIFSHEIKTPLSIIDSSRTNIARLHASPDVLDRTDKIARAVGAIDGLVDAMLAVEDLEARIGTAEHRTFGVHALIESCLHQAGAGQVSVDCPSDLALYADPALVRIALSNLLVNATLHGQRDGRVHVSAGALHPAGAWITVTNPGPELPQEIVSRLFEKHFRTPGSPGHGIGLWAASAIARRYGGAAAYSHDKSTGNSFTLRFGGNSS